MVLHVYQLQHTKLLFQCMILTTEPRTSKLYAKIQVVNFSLKSWTYGRLHPVNVDILYSVPLYYHTVA
jgi:hypothetical protein